MALFLTFPCQIKMKKTFSHKLYKLEIIFKYLKENKGKGIDQVRRKKKKKSWELAIEGQKREKYQLGGKG